MTDQLVLNAIKETVENFSTEEKKSLLDEFNQGYDKNSNLAYEASNVLVPFEAKLPSNKIMFNLMGAEIERQLS